MKYLKLFCDRYHCDTEFLVKVEERDIPEYYICPSCEGMVWVYEEDEKCFVDIESN